MIVGIHQLHYLPWLRYFEKIARSDYFVFLDDIQYNKNGWQNRNKIKGSGGEIILTIPVFNKFQQNLNEVEIDNKSNWSKKHWNSLVSCYSKAEYFKKYSDCFKDIYSRSWQRLNDINYEMLKRYLDILGIKTRFCLSSELNIPGFATERLINICKKAGGDTYLSGSHAKDEYLDLPVFEREGLKVVVQKWKAPIYHQLFPGNGFVPDLSILDLLFNEGDRSLEIIMESKNRLE